MHLLYLLCLIQQIMYYVGWDDGNLIPLPSITFIYSQHPDPLLTR